MSTNTPLWLTSDVLQDDVDRLVQALSLPERVARLLVVRQITSPEIARRFLYAHEQFSDGFDFHEMRTATERIRQAIRVGETIAIVGDYDVDGVTASLILASELQAQGAIWTCLIPERVADGYGLSVGLVEKAQACGATLIVTVDNGIRAADAVFEAVARGMDVIITDHHEPGDAPLPVCTAVVHWSLHEHPQDAVLLSGAGVAWKLAQALGRGRAGGQAPADHDAWLCGLAALGAISDVMPMRGENRRLIREGLQALRQCRRPGWLALCECARVDLDELSVTGISWRIAPRMNAAGRMAHAEVAFRLLMADKRAMANELANEIEQLNTVRKKSTDDAVQEALAEVAQMYGETPSAIVVAGAWPLGVVGIVAAKLSSQFGCPAIVLADSGEPVLRGSGRAPQGLSLHGALELCAEHLHHFGGHDAAVGCGVSREKLADFRNAFQDAIRHMGIGKMEDSEAKTADDFLPLDEANMETLEWVLRFSPHGPDNDPLRFFIGPVGLTRITPVGDGSHVRLRLQEGSTETDAIWFHAPDSVKRQTSVGQHFGLIVELEENTWQGKRSAQLRVVHGWQFAQPIMRDHFAQIYRHLRKFHVVDERTALQLVSGLDEEAQQVICRTFVELGFAAYRDGAYHVIETLQFRDLREAFTYQRHLQAQLVELD